MDSLKDLYKKHNGKLSDKWEIYLDTYNDIFNKYKNKNISMLEIGVQNGGSLELWNKYFENPKVLIGCDINKDCEKLTYTEDCINVIIGDANREEVKEKILNIEDEFDIILDDGSHISSDIIYSFFKYFPYLKDSGIFVIEDLHCSYWNEYQGGIYDPFSSISFFKKLVDIINYEHWYVDKSRTDVLKSICNYYSIDFNEDILSSIRSIEFVNSICIVRKRKSETNLLGERIRAGNEAIVSPETKAASSTNIVVDQSHNRWSTLDSDPAEEYFFLKSEIDRLNHELEYSKEQIKLIYSSTSWKITKPVRGLRLALGKFKRFFFKIKKIKKLFKVKEYLYCYLGDIKQKGFISASCLMTSKIKYKVFNFLTNDNKEPFYISKKRYKSWIAINENIDISRVKDLSNKHKYKPLISIVMPVYNVEIKYLQQAIESVIEQVYENWELCISDDCSENDEIRSLISQYAQKDPRVKYIFRTENGHISKNTNTALSIADGEWVALMDHDDKLSKYALFEVVDLLNTNKECEFIYTDEDKIDELNERSDPHFKGDFNLDLLYSQNYISHLGVYKRNIIDKIGGFRIGFEGSQDYDLLLRYIKCINVKNIYHINKILYHWRAISGSTALNSGEKSYTTDAGIKALKEHFENQYKVSKGLLDNTYKVHWPIHNNPKVSLIIPTYNGLEITKQAIESILTKTSYKNYEIILVDNNSDDPECLKYFDTIAKHPKVHLLRYPYPFNYSAINNYAVAHSEGELIGLINNDIEVINDDWLSEMVSLASREDVGCVGAKLYYDDGRIQHAGIIAGIGGVAGHSHKYYEKNSHGYFSRLKLRQNLLAVTAACLLVKRNIYNQVEGLNERYLTVAFNDVDFCFKVYEAGFLNVWTPYAELYHHESISRGTEDNIDKIRRFNREIDYMKNHWSHLIDNDPYYSRHLSKTRDDFSIK